MRFVPDARFWKVARNTNFQTAKLESTVDAFKFHEVEKLVDVSVHDFALADPDGEMLVGDPNLERPGMVRVHLSVPCDSHDADAVRFDVGETKKLELGPVASCGSNDRPRSVRLV